jgi:ADP-heptose:LPS heptosyltransferase
VRTVLILRALGLGDLLTGVPALRAIADAFPEHRRVLAAPRALAPLVEMTGAIDEIVDAAPLGPIVGVRRPDVAVNLHGRGPQSHRVLLVTEPGRLIAFRHPEIALTRTSPSWRSDEHEVDRWCRLLDEHGIPADGERLDLEPPPVGDETLVGATVIHPGASSGARRWPVERWAAVARSELADGRRVLFTGSASERPLASALASAAGVRDADVLAGSTDLAELASIVGAAGVVMSGDTGVAHLATALGTPSVVLFGPTPPARWGPPASRPRHVAVWAGRVGDPHGERTHAGLLEIGVTDVRDAARRARAAAASSMAVTA